MNPMQVPELGQTPVSTPRPQSHILEALKLEGLGPL